MPANYTSAIVYHGSRVPYLERFDSRFMGSGCVMNGKPGMGFYFSDSADAAGFYADPSETEPFDAFIVRAKITLEHPFVAPKGTGIRDAERMLGEALVRAFQQDTEEDYDGLIVPDVFDGDMHSTVYVVFNPSAIRVLGHGNAS